eukprot:SAG25_NODE_3056_length_1245_cov_1.230366_1_plen_270_part_00
MSDYQKKYKKAKSIAMERKKQIEVLQDELDEKNDELETMNEIENENKEEIEELKAEVEKLKAENAELKAEKQTATEQTATEEETGEDTDEEKSPQLCSAQDYINKYLSSEEYDKEDTLDWEELDQLTLKVEREIEGCSCIHPDDSWVVNQDFIELKQIVAAYFDQDLDAMSVPDYVDGDSTNDDDDEADDEEDEEPAEDTAETRCESIVDKLKSHGIEELTRRQLKSIQQNAHEYMVYEIHETEKNIVINWKADDSAHQIVAKNLVRKP